MREVPKWRPSASRVGVCERVWSERLTHLHKVAIMRDRTILYKVRQVYRDSGHGLCIHTPRPYTAAGQCEQHLSVVNVEERNANLEILKIFSH